MLKALIANASSLKKIFTSIKGIVELANFECDENGIRLETLDSSHVAFVGLKLMIPYFVQYECTRSMILGVNFEALHRIIDVANNDDTVQLQFKFGEDILSIIFEDAKKTTKTKYELKLMNIEADPITAPDADYTSRISMESDTFRKLVADFSKFGQQCDIIVKPNKLVFKVFGEKGNGKVTMRPSEESKMTMVSEGQLKLCLALRYLANFTRATDVSPTVKIDMIPDSPLRITYEIIGSLCLQFFLAPKMDEI